MKISVNTNVLARAVLNDDLAQSRVARKLLREASLIAVPLPSLCELVWVLRQGAKLPKEDVATAVRSLMNVGNVVVNRPASELGLAVLEAGLPIPDDEGDSDPPSRDERSHTACKWGFDSHCDSGNVAQTHLMEQGLFSP
jgi:hypothetical protein